VHSTIHYFKIPPFHRDVVDDDPSSADTTPLIRTGENKWTNYVISQESFLTPQEVSRKAGVSRSTVYNWINKGISHTRDGRKKILTPKGELEVKQREKERKVSDQRAQDNHVFALAWSIKRGTALSSAETQIKRLRLKGWNSQDIAAFIGREYVEQATRKLA
jgi:excisionase family DNA binding protein